MHEVQTCKQEAHGNGQSMSAKARAHHHRHTYTHTQIRRKSRIEINKVKNERIQTHGDRIEYCNQRLKLTHTHKYTQCGQNRIKITNNNNEKAYETNTKYPSQTAQQLRMELMQQTKMTGTCENVSTEKEPQMPLEQIFACARACLCVFVWILRSGKSDRQKDNSLKAPINPLKRTL